MNYEKWIPMSRDFPKKVFVGLSGGVDSSVSAALLKKDGYAVTGVFIRVWNPASEQSPTLNREKGRTLFGLCEAAEDRLDAMRVCAKLNIPFVELNLEKEYKKEVVDYMIREYKAGKTPNPDVFCNRFIKFGGFYEFARKSGADFIATGHYARIVKRYERYEHQILGNENLMLVASADRNKDQSYFLWQIKKEQLPNILFPVGGMRKPEVRRLAKRFGLITADKKDSQGLCFVGKVDMKEFLSHYIKPRKGKVLDENGRVVGEHSGAFFYTIGERIAVSPPPSLEGGTKGGWYVIAKNMRKNTLTVFPKSSAGKLPLSVTEVAITDCNWLTPPVAGKTYRARLRYRQPLQEARFKIHDSRFMIQFADVQTVAPGQSLVLYDDEVCVGGGIIM